MSGAWSDESVAPATAVPSGGSVALTTGYSGTLKPWGLRLTAASGLPAPWDTTSTFILNVGDALDITVLTGCAGHAVGARVAYDPGAPPATAEARYDGATGVFQATGPDMSGFGPAAGLAIRIRSSVSGGVEFHVWGLGAEAEPATWTTIPGADGASLSYVELVGETWTGSGPPTPTAASLDSFTINWTDGCGADAPTIGQTIAPEQVISDGVTTSFTTNYPYAPGSLQLGPAAGAIIATETNPATGAFSIPSALPAGTVIAFTYVVADSTPTGAGNLAAAPGTNIPPYNLVGTGGDGSGTHVLYDTPTPSWSSLPATPTAAGISYDPSATVTPLVSTDVQAAITELEAIAAAGGGSGAPTTADYLVGTAQAGLSAEIVVGTAPGGELGGSWPSPTVDASHSGSSHADAQAAAESTAAGALAAHAGASDPHPGYLTPAEGDAAYDPLGAAAAAQGAAIATAASDATTKANAAQAAAIAASDPAGAAAAVTTSSIGAVPTARTIGAGTGLTGGGDLSANRSLAADFGTGAGKVTQGNDARLSDARTPTAHATSHKTGGSDAIKLDELAAPDDNTNTDATTGHHGLLPKLDGNAAHALLGDGSFGASPGGAPSGSAGGDLGGTYPNPTVAQASAAFALIGVISPAQITADQDDYDPPGLAGATVIRLDSDADNHFLFGLAGGVNGREMLLVNVSAFTLILSNESSTTPGDRFLFAANPSENYVLEPRAGVRLWYDGVSSRWRIISYPTEWAAKTFAMVAANGFSINAGNGPLRLAGTLVFITPAPNDPDVGATAVVGSSTEFTWQALASNRSTPAVDTVVHPYCSSVVEGLPFVIPTGCVLDVQQGAVFIAKP